MWLQSRIQVVRPVRRGRGKHSNSACLGTLWEHSLYLLRIGVILYPELSESVVPVRLRRLVVVGIFPEPCRLGRELQRASKWVYVHAVSIFLVSRLRLTKSQSFAMRNSYCSTAERVRSRYTPGAVHKDTHSCWHGKLFDFFSTH